MCEILAGMVAEERYAYLDNLKLLAEEQRDVGDKAMEQAINYLSARLC